MKLLEKKTSAEDLRPVLEKAQSEGKKSSFMSRRL